MELTQHPIIYKIQHRASGRVYVGSATNPRKRWNEHRRDLTAGEHHSQKLQNAWAKYGADAFDFAVLEVVESRAELLFREQHWINALSAASRSNFNICPVAGAPMAGRSPSAETRVKLRVAMLGNKHCIGHKHSDEARQRMGASKVGQKRSTAQRANMSAAQVGNAKKRGWKTPDRTRDKLSAAMSGNTNALGVKHAPRTRRPHSDATKLVMSIARKTYFARLKAVIA